MKVESGKYYVDSNGDIVGPMAVKKRFSDGVCTYIGRVHGKGWQLEVSEDGCGDDGIPGTSPRCSNLVKEAKTCYIAGPMRGIKWFNFPEFDQAVKVLKKQGYFPISPAEIDRNNGFHPEELPEDHDWNVVPETGPTLAQVVDRDIKAVLECDAIYLLKGWEKSTGARAEYAVARFKHAIVMLEPGAADPASLYAPDQKVPDVISAEDPEEWVTQDRVPARPTDERRWVNVVNCSFHPPDDWTLVDKAGTIRNFGNNVRHGYVDRGLRLELRCRRKDLPPLQEPKPTELPEGAKDSNPKDVIGSKKPAIGYVPCAPLFELGAALQSGALKYGAHNWRAIGVRSSVYYNAAMRHIMSWWEGEDSDQESGMSHLMHAAACIFILRDSALKENLTDDRPLQSVHPYQHIKDTVEYMLDNCTNPKSPYTQIPV
jgi:hypothetical protein